MNNFCVAIHPHLRRPREHKHLPSSAHPELITHQTSTYKENQGERMERLKVILGLKALDNGREKYTFSFTDRN